MSFQAWKQSERDQRLIRVQQRFIGILAVLCALLGIGWLLAPTYLKIFIPPDLSNGAWLKPNEIPKPLIYSFAYQVWQEINHWPQNGEQDYAKALRTYQAYVTPSFQATLADDDQALSRLGQLQRQRTLQGIDAFDPSSVTALTNHSWQVNLTLHLTEYQNHQVVKSIDMLYPLKVVQISTSEQQNPYGLALAGFVHEPTRLKTYAEEPQP